MTGGEGTICSLQLLRPQAIEQEMKWKQHHSVGCDARYTKNNFTSKVGFILRSPDGYEIICIEVASGTGLYVCADLVEIFDKEAGVDTHHG